MITYSACLRTLMPAPRLQWCSPRILLTLAYIIACCLIASCDKRSCTTAGLRATKSEAGSEGQSTRVLVFCHRPLTRALVYCHRPFRNLLCDISSQFLSVIPDFRVAINIGMF